MFGETDSESPRMPSPWEALSLAPSPSPSPLLLSACSTSNNSTTTLTEAANPVVYPGSLRDARPAIPQDLKYLNVAKSSEYVPSGLSSSLLASQTDAFPKLSPEVEEGNVEYKLKLIDPSPSRFARLVTQLKYRLLEGGGQALYEIGVSDFGDLVGLSRNDLEASLDTLDQMAGELRATVVVLKEIELPKGVSGKLPGAQVGFAMGPREQSVPYTKTVGKKDRDKEARRVRRAAALVVADVVGVNEDAADDATALASCQRDLSPSYATANPSPDFDADLSRTVTLPPKTPPASTTPTFLGTQPMPIITNYPYGRQPFANSKAQTNGRSVSSSTGCGTVSSVSTAGSFAAGPNSASSTSFDAPGLTSEIDDEDYVYMPASVSASATSSDDNGNKFGGRKAVDDEGDPAFDFACDLEIASFAAGSQVILNQPKPLHYCSFASRSGGHEAAALLAVDDTLSSASLRPVKSARPKKKPIILTPPSQDSAEKAAGKRMKRDARRDERQRQKLKPPPSGKDPSSELSDPGPRLGAHAPNNGSEPSNHIVNKGNGNPGPRLIAEALVVRKLALEEAFLDFGGFSLVEALASSMILDDDDELGV